MKITKRKVTVARIYYTDKGIVLSFNIDGKRIAITDITSDDSLLPILEEYELRTGDLDTPFFYDPEFYGHK